VDAVKGLLTQANFATLGWDGDGWKWYAALTDSEKTAVATAVYNDGSDYVTSSLLSNAIGYAIMAAYDARADAVKVLFNAADSVDAVKLLLTQANFAALSLEGLWGGYSDLADERKTVVATAVYNNGGDYSTSDDLTDEIYNVVLVELANKNIVTVKAKLDAAIAPAATAADINALIAYCATLEGSSPTKYPSVNAGNLVATKAAIAAALAETSNPLKVYKEAENPTAKEAINAISVVIDAIPE
jgi:hypothetical protein